MDSNPLDALLDSATRDYPAEGNDVLMEWWAQEYGPRLLAVVKAARKKCKATLDSEQPGWSNSTERGRYAHDLLADMQAAAEVPHGK